MTAIYKEDITEDTLKNAAKIYFGLVFCPDNDPEIVQFYQELFQNFRPETVLKILARILFVANEKRLFEHYNIAKALFDKGPFTNDVLGKLSISQKLYKHANMISWGQ